MKPWKPGGEPEIREADVVAAVTRRLQACGYVYRVTASDKRKRKQERGLPDVLAWRSDVTLLIECKQPGGRVRESQVDFYEQVSFHLGEHLRYLLIDNVEMVEEVID